MNLFKSVNRLIPFFAGIIFIIVRLIGDVVFYFLGLINTDNLQMWRLISSLVIGASFYLYFFADTYKKTDEDSGDLSEGFMSELGQILMFLLGLLISRVFVPDSFSENGQIFNIFGLLVVELNLFISIVLSAQILWFLHKWLLIRRHKKTVTYIRIISAGLMYLIGYEIINYISPSFDFLESINSFFLLVFTIIVFLAAKKNAWIATLPRSRKFRFLWLSLIVWIITLSMSIVSSTESSFAKSILTLHIPGTSYLYQASILFITAYSIRLFFAVLFALPTTGIMERRTSEITSLTYLNRFITDSASKDVSYLMETVTQLALHASGGSAVWTEIYNDDNSVKIGAAINLNPVVIISAHENTNLKNSFLSIVKPNLIASVPESQEFSFLNSYIPVAKAMIAIPLFEGTKRFGTLVVLDSEEFGLEQDDVKVLAAFGDNVNLALENSRLLKDSIEKERYQSELMIAKRIQNQLLPQTLPIITNFSISAFSIPADEVGGDYYDVVQIKDGRTCVVIGDVSGKGMSAAFYMAQLKGVVHSFAPRADGPADLLKKINATLFGLMEKKSFITMGCLAIDNKYGQITFARAGHMPLIVKSENKLIELAPKGIGIALSPAHIFDKLIDEATLLLDSHDVCLLYTDGVNELRNQDGEELGVDSIRKKMMSEKIDSAEELIEKLEGMTLDFKSTAHQHDDMTSVAIHFRGIKIQYPENLE